MSWWPFRAKPMVTTGIDCWVIGCPSRDATSIYVNHPQSGESVRVYLCPLHRSRAEQKPPDTAGLVIPDDPKSYWPERNL